MANPLEVSTPKDAWTLIATNVVTGNVHKVKTNENYLQTYRVTSDPAPTVRTEGVPLFIDNIVSEKISSSFAIDIYVWCDGAGVVRVDV